MTDEMKNSEPMTNEELEDEEWEEEDRIVITFDDDTESECVILEIFPVEDREYVALVPVEDLENEDEEAEIEILLFRYEEDENGEMLISDIETDEEYEKVSAAADRVLSEEDDEEHEEQEDAE